MRGDKKRDGESGEQVGKNQSCLLYHGGWLAPDLAANILAADFRAAVSPASWRKRYAGAPKSTMASQKWFSSTEPSRAFSRKCLGELRGHVTSGQTSMTRQAISQLMRAVMMVMSP